MTLTIDEIMAHFEAVKRASPIGGRTPVYLDTPDGYCVIRDVRPDIVDSDDDENEPAAIVETEPAAFGGDDDY